LDYIVNYFIVLSKSLNKVLQLSKKKHLFINDIQKLNFLNLKTSQQNNEPTL
jgi:hypothetical protein